MFLFTVTHHSIIPELHLQGVEEYRVENLFFTLYTRGGMPEVTDTREALGIVEAPGISGRRGLHRDASGIWYDTRNKELQLYRTFVSGRPVYYHISADGDLYCSTHIRLLREAGVPIEENSEVLPEYFVYRYVFPPATLFSDISQVPAGSSLLFTLRDGRLTLKETCDYSPPEKMESGDFDLHEIVEQVKENLTGILESADALGQPLTLLLSGGLDSSILTQIAHTRYGVNDTYSTDYPFENPEANREREYAITAGEALGVNHHYQRFTTEEYLHGFIRALAVAEVPVSHLQSVPLFLLMNRHFGPEEATVLFGTSADNNFGSHEHLKFRKASGIDRSPLSGLAAQSYPVLQTLVNAVDKGYHFIEPLKYVGSTSLPVTDPDHYLWRMKAYGSEEWACRFFGVNREDIIRSRLEWLDRYEDLSLYDILSLYFAVGASANTQEIWSKFGEENGKGAIYPYSNAELLDLSFSIPWKTKLREKKYLLRKTARKLGVPEFIITRPKSGFGINAEKWARRGTALEPLVPLASKVIDEDEIRALQSADSKLSMSYWNLLNYAVWKRLWIDGEPVEDLQEELSEVRDRTESVSE